MIAKRLFLNHSPSEWFSFIQKIAAEVSAAISGDVDNRITYS